MSDNNTIKMMPAEMADYNRGVNAFLEGELMSCPSDATAALVGWKRTAASWREYEIEECNRYGWGRGGYFLSAVSPAGGGQSIVGLP